MKNYTYHHIFQLKIGELKKGLRNSSSFTHGGCCQSKNVLKYTHTCTTHMDEIYYLIFNWGERDYCYYFGKHISSAFDCLLSSRGNFFTVRIFNFLMYACNLVIDVKLIVLKDFFLQENTLNIINYLKSEQFIVFEYNCRQCIYFVNLVS